MKSLSHITEEFRRFDELLEEMGGEITEPMVEQMFDDWFASLGEEAGEKIDGYITFMAELDARAEARKAEAAEWRRRAAAIDKQAALQTAKRQRLQERLLMFLDSRGLQSYETRRFTIKARAAGGKRKLVCNAEPADVPERFRKVVTSIDNDAVRAAIELGELIEWARLEPRGRTLTIK